MNWSKVKISAPDPLWQLANKLNRSDCKTAREIVLAHRANEMLRFELEINNGNNPAMVPVNSNAECQQGKTLGTEISGDKEVQARCNDYNQHHFTAWPITFF